MANYGFHEDCYPPVGCGSNCPYNNQPRPRPAPAPETARVRLRALTEDMVCKRCGHNQSEHGGNASRGACHHAHQAIILDPVSGLVASRCGCERFRRDL